MIENLLLSIEQILLQHPHGLSEYKLIKALQSDSNQKITDLSMNDPEQLFRLHFIVFHCLYLLRDRWLENETACLEISALNISRSIYSKSQQHELVQADPLRAYYLDFNNLQNTDANQIEQLIASFWHKFVSAPELKKALKVFELGENIDFKQIKSRYKQLAMLNHPDRGGSASRLAEINQAMTVLKRYYRV